MAKLKCLALIYTVAWAVLTKPHKLKQFCCLDLITFQKKKKRTTRLKCYEENAIMNISFV